MLVLLLAALESDSDREKFLSIYNDYHDVMMKSAGGILSEQADVEDAVQNAFLQIIRHFDRISDIPYPELRGWCITITRNEARQIHRRAQKTIPLEDWAKFEREALDSHDWNMLVECFTRLPETYRAVLEMRLLLGYSTNEIALILNISPSTAESASSAGASCYRRS